jgi:hypothetical protein
LEREGVLGRTRSAAHGVDGGERGVLAFELGWGEVAEGGVPAPGVVEALDVLEDRGSGLGAGGPRSSVDALFLEGGVKRFADGVVDRCRLRLMPLVRSELSV